MSKLLMNEIPLMVQPSLAVKIGLNEALFLQQLHYWLDRSNKVVEGKRWVYNTVEEWHEQFPFWSVRTLRRIIANLEKMELILSGNFNRINVDRTKWYTINYEILENLSSNEDDAKDLGAEQKFSENNFSENDDGQPMWPNCPNAKNQGSEAIIDNKSKDSENDSSSGQSMWSNWPVASGQSGQSMWPICPNASGQNGHTNNHKQQQRLPAENTTTTLSDNLPSDDGVVVDKKLLKKQLTMTAAKCGIRAGNMKIFFGKYKLEDISRQLILLEKNMKKGTISNPAGWLRSALENGYVDSQAESALLAEKQKQAAIKKAQERSRLQLEALKKQQELDSQVISRFGKDLSITEQDDIDIAQKRREVKRRTVNDNRT